MIYHINNTDYCDFNTIRVQRLPARSYFIPYPDRAQAEAVSGSSVRYSSPKVKCLNGEWDFRFYPRPADMPLTLDTDKIDFDRIDVPSCWQFRGYDRPFYVNTRYQFPYDPPAIPQLEKAGRTFAWVGADFGVGPRFRDPGDEYNFAGVYRTFFETETAGGESGAVRRHVLCFLGVASCIDVYVNEQRAGYSEGSHNMAEFDVTGLVHAGRNELVAVVRRWCTGSYLECQDMFRNNGIFRDVLLKVTDGQDIWDMDFRTSCTGGKYEADATVTIEGKPEDAEGTEVSFTLKGPGIDITKTAICTGDEASVRFEGLEPVEWTAETPVLYDLICEAPGTCVRQRVGFRQVRIRDDVFLINRRKVKLHGVNHHDTSPVNGYYMTPEEIRRDMELCKEYNIDTVRTSHYPPDPYLLEVCDELGIYVVDEADLETHGVYTQKLPPSYNRLSDDPEWVSHYVDRAERLYQRDKMHPSIIMWSLGNESGAGFNTDMMYSCLKKQGADLPVHYESAVHSSIKAYDVASEMYPPVSRVHEIGEKTYKISEMTDRPYFLCEYAHAMGVGPGDMEAYWKEIYSYDSLMGGCVWEMVDHAVLHEDGRYTYGGDHGEWEHDGNFCVDGMFYPDRRPSTGARIAKFIYRPVRISRLAGNTFEIFNTTGFTPGERFLLKCRWSDGHEEEIVPSAGPLMRTIVRLEADLHGRACREAGIDCLLTVTTIDRETGREAAREQLIIEEHVPDMPADAGRALPDWFSIKNGRPVIRDVARASDPYTILFRAPVDNDFVLFGLKNAIGGFTGQKERIRSVTKEEGRITVRSDIRCRMHHFICTDVYEGCEEGVLVTSRLRCVAGGGNLPRFGKAFAFDRSFDNVRYYGRNGESYADMKDQAQIEHVECRVSDMTEPNIRPQESGNRCDCRMAEVSDGKHAVRFTAVGDSFDLGIKPYTDRELLGMKHREDEARTGTYVTLSAFQQGIGTGICGPATAPEYCMPARGEYELRFIISIR